MPFTFECGVCQAVYRLDEEQITASGVKITCPKCMNFFFLRRSAKVQEKPLIEHIVQDGVYDVSPPPEKETKPVPPSNTTPSPLFPPARRDAVQPTPRGHLVKSDTQVTDIELNDYPPEQPPHTAFDQLLVPVSLILLAIAALLFLNFTGTVKIPGLDAWRRTAAPVLTEPLPVATPETNSGRKYGFPSVDPADDPWKATPLPTPTK